VQKTLPAGSWAIQANAIIHDSYIGGKPFQLRGNGTIIARAIDKRSSDSEYWATLPMNGLVFVNSGTAGVVDVVCRAGSLPVFQSVQATAPDHSIQVGSFF
jgi:hypothetical protein